MASPAPIGGDTATPQARSAENRIAVDAGGTFTDYVYVDARGAVRRTKLDAGSVVPAPPPTPISQAAATTTLLYGTTCVVNALHEKRFDEIALIVTRGFRHLVCEARIGRPMAAPGDPAPRSVIALENAFEIGGRLDANGGETVPLARDEVAPIVDELRARGVRRIVVSLLHSYANPAHERALREYIHECDATMVVTLSSDLQRESREHERTLAACVNGALASELSAHVDAVAARNGVDSQQLLLMKSSGGLAPLETVSNRALSTALSGPTAAAIAMARVARDLGYENAISIDVGGTSADVSIVADGVLQTADTLGIADLQIRMPAIEFVTIGAGGGSIARQDLSGRWRVGPESAGSQPGPACYGRGGFEATVCDAQLVLRQLPPGLLDGTLTLDTNAATAALAKLGATRKLDAAAAAAGVLDILHHQLCGAVRTICAGKGRDARDYVLVAAGGAGGLHAAELARLCGIRKVIIPSHPGFIACRGLLESDLLEDRVLAMPGLVDALDPTCVAQNFRALAEEVRAAMAPAIDAYEPEVALERFVDLRYSGMLSELSTPVDPDDADLSRATERFHQRFLAMNGFSRRDQAPVEVVNLRVVGRRPPAYRHTLSTDGGYGVPHPAGSRTLWFGGHGWCDARIQRREHLAAGSEVSGPAVIEEYSSTTLVPPDARINVGAEGSLVMTLQ